MTVKPCDRTKSGAYVASSAPPFSDDRDLAHLSSVDLQFFREREAAFVRESAFHEAAHAIAGAANGFGVRYVSIGASGASVSFESPGAGKVGALDLLTRSIAGTIGEGIASGCIRCPSAAEMSEALARARADIDGRCDRCFEARVLVRVFPDADDQTLIATWRGAFRIVLEIFEHPEWRGALHVLARELHERILLERDDIEQILQRYDLHAAQDEVLCSIGIAALLPAFNEELTCTVA